MSVLIGNPTVNIGVTLQKSSALEGVALSPGQSISGKVQSVEQDGKVILNLAGKTVEAVSEVPLAAGQEINLEVVGRTDGRLYLKLSGAPAAASLLEPELLVNQLAAPPMSTPNYNQTALVSTLLANQLPVTDKNLAALTRVASVLSSLGEITGTAAAETGTAGSQVRAETALDLKLAGFILTAGLKDQPEVWPVLKDYFQQPSNLGASLEKLVQGLSTLTPGEPAQPAAGTVVPPTADAAVFSELDRPVPAGPLQPGGQTAAAAREPAPAAATTSASPAPALTTAALESSIVITPGAAPLEEVVPTAPAVPAGTGTDKAAAEAGQSAVIPDEPAVPMVSDRIPTQPKAGAAAPAANQQPTQTVQPAAADGRGGPPQAALQTGGVSVPVDETAASPPAGVVVNTMGAAASEDVDAALGTAKYTAPAELELYGRLLTELLGDSGQDSSPAGKVLTQMSALIGLLGKAEQPLDSESIKGQLKEWLSIQKPLTQLLNLVKTEIGKEEVARLLLHDKLVELGQAVNTSLQEVVGHQVINTVDKSQPTMPDYYYFSWPLQSQNQESQAELRVYRQKGRNQPLDMNDLYLVFCLRTPNLGTNRFDIHLLQKRMEFRVTVEKDGVVEMVKGAWPELAERMEELGFQADLIECRSGTPEQLRPQPEAKASLEGLRRIDVLA